MKRRAKGSGQFCISGNGKKPSFFATNGLHRFGHVDAGGGVIIAQDKPTCRARMAERCPPIGRAGEV